MTTLETPLKGTRGLTIEKLPRPIFEGLSTETLTLLEKDGFGITFPIRSCCQVRLRRHKKTYGKTFNYVKHGSIQLAVDAAINWVREQREQFLEAGIPPIMHRGKNGVYFHKRDTVRDDRFIPHAFQYTHVVAYHCTFENKPRNKHFWHGYDNPTPGQWLHGQHTALLFKMMIQEYEVNRGIPVNREWFANWKTKRLYMKGHPPVNYEDL